MSLFVPDGLSIDLLCNKSPQVRRGDVAIVRVLFEHFRAENLIAEVLHSFGRKELEWLRDCHGRDAHPFIVSYVFHRHDALRRLEGKMLIRMECRILS